MLNKKIFAKIFFRFRLLGAGLEDFIRQQVDEVRDEMWFLYFYLYALVFQYTDFRLLRVPV